MESSLDQSVEATYKRGLLVPAYTKSKYQNRVCGLLTITLQREHFSFWTHQMELFIFLRTWTRTGQLNHSVCQRELSLISTVSQLFPHQTLLTLILIGVVTDPQTGLMIDSFEFMTANNLQFTVVAEDQLSVKDLKEAFIMASQKALVKKQSYAQKIGSGMTQVVKVPWKLTKVVVLSLEKVRFSEYLINPTLDRRWTGGHP